MLTISVAAIVSQAVAPPPPGAPASPARQIAGSISDADYPPPAIRAQEQGTTSISIVVGADGVPTACKVTQSSGSATLDTATCKAVTERFRYEPARDRAGKAVTAEVRRRVSWVLPRGSAAMVRTPLVFGSGLMRLTTSPLLVGKKCTVEWRGEPFQALAERLCPPSDRLSATDTPGTDAVTFVLKMTAEGSPPPAPVPVGGTLAGEIEVDLEYNAAGELVSCREVVMRRAGSAAPTTSPCTRSDGNFFTSVTPDPTRPMRRARARMEVYTQGPLKRP